MTNAATSIAGSAQDAIHHLVLIGYFRLIVSFVTDILTI
jgi:hypothetical protein